MHAQLCLFYKSVRSLVVVCATTSYVVHAQVFTGLKLRVCNENLIFLFLNQNICCGYSKEPS